MQRTVKLLIIASLLKCVLTYFEYSDCDDFCRSHNRSCTISMINAENFPNDCIEFESGCVRLATRLIVCIRKNHSAVGGEKMWDAFSEYNPRPTTTSGAPPRPNPPKPSPTTSSGPESPVSENPSRSQMYALIAYSSATTITLLIVAGFALQRFIQKRFTRDYGRINERQPIVGSPNSPLENTESEL